jgi:hypothetical protein
VTFLGVIAIIAEHERVARRQGTRTDMPTREFKPLLEREVARAAIKPITGISTPLLQEIVDASLRAFRRCEAAEHGKENEDVAALVLFRQVIEMADGIEVHVAHGCGTAAIPVVRSQFEAGVALAYLLSDDAKYVERSLSWLVDRHAAISERGALEPDLTSRTAAAATLSILTTDDKRSFDVGGSPSGTQQADSRDYRTARPSGALGKQCA